VSRHEYTLKAKNGSLAKSFCDSHLKDGDPITISRPGSASPVAVGYLLNISSSTLIVSADRSLDAQNTFKKPIAKLSKSPRRNYRVDIAVESDNNTFIVDRDSYSSEQSLLRGNLIQLFLPELYSKLRQLIVDGVAPVFEPIDDEVVPHTDELNDNQMHAIKKALSGISV
jgi:hypothetical protein